MDPLEKLNQDTLPFARPLGIRLLSAAPDRVVAEMIVRDDLCTRPAVLHGGALMAFADTLGATGTIVNLPEGAATPTIESKPNFIAPAPVRTPPSRDPPPPPPPPPPLTHHTRTPTPQ